MHSRLIALSGREHALRLAVTWVHHHWLITGVLALATALYLNRHQLAWLWRRHVTGVSDPFDPDIVDMTPAAIRTRRKAGRPHELDCDPSHRARFRYRSSYLERRRMRNNPSWWTSHHDDHGPVISARPRRKGRR